VITVTVSVTADIADSDSVATAQRHQRQSAICADA
jgi:hypothetical protein